MYLVIFIIGTIFWSLWSVLLTRLEDGFDRDRIKGILFWFSKCPHCHKRLKAKNLVPILSFLWQNGKCEYCKTKISWQYPILEIASGIIFMFSYYLIFNIGVFLIPEGTHWIQFIFRAITNRWLLLLIVQDIKTQDLHMPIWIITTAWILIRQFTNIVWNYQATVVTSLLFAGIFMIIYLWAKLYIKQKYKTNQEGFGQGDIFLAFTLWALIPFVEQFNAQTITINNHFKIIISIILIWSILGIIYALFWIINKTNKKSKFANKNKIIIPFFPSLIIAFWIVLVFWDKILFYLFK